MRYFGISGINCMHIDLTYISIEYESEMFYMYCKFSIRFIPYFLADRFTKQ